MTNSFWSIWSRFGFSANPYSEETLLPDETGHILLAGRDSDIRSIQRRIGSGGAHPSVEGPIGAGKTSLINVASYRMMRHSVDLGAKEIYLPAVNRLQPRESANEFETEFFQIVAQTIIKYRSDIERVGLTVPPIDEMARWLNDPEYASSDYGVQIAGTGGNVSQGREPNSAGGYQQSGFSSAVRDVLQQTFPAGSGGIVCVLDNLEILESVGKARNTLDELRDRVFNIPEIRWVLCGSRGIVSRARSERLSGYFKAPRVVGRLSKNDAVEVIRRRIDYYGSPGAVPPVSPESFEFIYESLNSNMRDSLATAQEFSEYLDESFVEDSEIPGASRRDEMLVAWLHARAQRAYDDAPEIQDRQWQFFNEFCLNGGQAGSSEFGEYSFVNQQQFSNAVSSLARANLMVREVDPDNGTRTLNSVTPLGWLVFAYLNSRLRSVL